MSYQFMKRYEGSLNAYYLVKGSNLKRLPTVYDSSYMAFWKGQSDGDN